VDYRAFPERLVKRREGKMQSDDNKVAGKIDAAYVARLARVELTEDEIRTFQPQLDEIVGYVNKMRELDLEQVEPTSHAVALENVFRRDEVKPGLKREEVLRNAPWTDGSQFLVPKIME